MNDPEQICLEEKSWINALITGIKCQSFDYFLVSIIVFGGWHKNR